MNGALSWLIGGSSQRASHALLAPAAFWLLFFLVIPVAFLLPMSMAHRGLWGDLVWTPTWTNFARAFDPRYLPVLARTVGFASATAAACLALGFPVAYFLSFHAGRYRGLLLAGLMIPFWTSSLVALYSWMIILGREGLLNSTLLSLRLLDAPLEILNTRFSVLLGMVYFYLPFMVLPLYASLEKIPRQCVEASYDLGAGVARTFFKVTLPLSLPGVFAGCVLTFVPCMGDFLTADFLGGPDTYLLGNLIQNQFLMAQNWPFGAALTSLLLLLLIGGILVYERVSGEPR